MLTVLKRDIDIERRDIRCAGTCYHRTLLARIPSVCGAVHTLVHIDKDVIGIGTVLKSHLNQSAAVLGRADNILQVRHLYQL